MGYETYFEVYAKPELTQEMVDDIAEQSGYEMEFSGSVATISMGRAKWYEYDNDMLAVSAKHPATLFKVTGDGEECPDLWHHYFRGGKDARYEAEVTFPEFNPKDLK